MAGETMKRRMKEPTKDEYRRRLAVAEARVAYLEGMTLRARLGRWIRRVVG